jgi:hypothetical protein
MERGTTMICPTCHSPHIRKSQSGNARLLFPLSLFMVWVRCYYCGKRFLRFGLVPGMKVPTAEGQRHVAA